MSTRLTFPFAFAQHATTAGPAPRRFHGRGGRRIAKQLGTSVVATAARLFRRNSRIASHLGRAAVAAAARLFRRNSRIASYLGRAAVAAALLSAWPGVGHAEEMILSGPHPFLKENAASVQFLLGNGLGDSFSGRGIGLGYGYMLEGPLWLDLQMNVRAASCSPVAACGARSGNDVELMAGASWRIRTRVPLVPYLRGGGGLVYAYPRSASNAIGLAARAGVGAKYYVVDWLGFGMEAALSLGHIYFDRDYTASHNYAVFDVAVGVEWQF